MKVLSGVYPHGTWDGEIIWEGQPLKAASIRDTERAGIIIIHQELMLVPELSVAENIFLGNEITLLDGAGGFAARKGSGRPYGGRTPCMARLRSRTPRPPPRGPRGPPLGTSGEWSPTVVATAWACCVELARNASQPTAGSRHAAL